MLTDEQELDIKLKHKCKLCKSNYICFNQKLLSCGMLKQYMCSCKNAEVIEKIIIK